VLTRRAAAAEELHEARKVKEAIIHPDTGASSAHARPRASGLSLKRRPAGEPVFAPLRLSFIVPCNLVLDTLMMSGALLPRLRRAVLQSAACCAAQRSALTRTRSARQRPDPGRAVAEPDV
jgi:hypothetical protein